MKETVVSKRPREDVEEEEEVDSEEYSKRHKPFNHILSLLESEEDEATEDLSSLITTLQQEITNSASHSDTLLSQAQEYTQHNPTATSEDHSDSASSSSSSSSKGQILKVDEEEEDKRRVMRHLLEASDDELGIPNTGNGGLMGFGDDIGFHGGENHGVPFSDGLWELEDESANYYALLQSQLFM